MSKQSFDYQYVTLRLVPSILREEFLNVGVVVYSQEGEFLRGAHHIDEARCLSFAPQLDLESVIKSLDSLCTLASDGARNEWTPRMDKLGPRFGWISAPRSTILQPGPVHGGQSVDLPATLDWLLQSVVLPLPPQETCARRKR